MITPLRTIEKLWITYFVIMIPISALIDTQALWPVEVPLVLQGVKNFWIAQSNDFLFAGGWAGKVETAWFESFLFTELVFQLPTYFIAIYGLLHRSRSIYILLLAYGAMTSTMSWACVATIVTASTKGGSVELKSSEYAILMLAYTPFVVIPFTMAVDSALVLRTMVEGTNHKLKGSSSIKGSTGVPALRCGSQSI